MKKGKGKEIRSQVISFKTTKAVKAKLVELAAKGDRSMSRTIERLIKSASLT